MELSRREFLYGASSALTVSTVPGAIHAFAGPTLLYPPRDLSYFDTPLPRGPAEIHIGYAAITWDGNDPRAIEDISALGYSGIQLRANALREFPDPYALKDLLDRHHLKFAAFSSGTVALDPAQERANLAMHEEHARYLYAAGGRVLQIIGSSRGSGALTADDFQREGKLLTEIAKRVADHGVQTGFHNHMGTIGQTPEDVQKILDASDPRYVKLLLDTGHFEQGGGDPAAAIRKYSDRLLCIHLKDVRPDRSVAGYQFTELGQGKVNFSAVMAALRAIHFRGWAVVELDEEESGSTRTPKESAAMSKQYIEQTLGVRV